jgi:hypothetical protein
MIFMQKENLLIVGWQLNRDSGITFFFFFCTFFSFREKFVHTNVVVMVAVAFLDNICDHELLKKVL